MAIAVSVATGLAKKLETWRSVRLCSAMASATTGWEWPSEVTASPQRKSRYRRPWSSHSSVPCPRTNITCGGPKTGQ